MEFTIKEKGKFSYIDEGEGDLLLLLHGLFGALSNWEQVITHFSKKHRVVIPMLPIYTMPVKKAGVPGLVKYVSEFIDLMEMSEINLLGNSLGGHVALVYTLENPKVVKSVVLTGSSGLFENSTGGAFPKRGNYEFVKERVEYTFYDPTVATKPLVDEVFGVTKSIPKCMRIVAIAKSAQRHNMADDIVNITQPTLLVWGLNDTITPPIVAHDFNRLIPNTTMRFVDKCGHAPMMEHPNTFNSYLDEFFENIKT